MGGWVLKKDIVFDPGKPGRRYDFSQSEQLAIHSLPDPLPLETDGSSQGCHLLGRKTIKEIMPRRLPVRVNEIQSEPVAHRVSDKNVLSVRYVFGSNRIHANLLKIGCHQEEFIEGIPAKDLHEVSKFVHRFKLAAIQNHFDFVVELPIQA